MSSATLRVIVVKPSKYGRAGFVERFHRGLMPNSTVPCMRSMTPDRVGGDRIEIHTVDEYVRTDVDYLELLQKAGCPTLLAFVGVQSHQFQRSLDLAAFARSRGVEHCIIGGPHPMTCDTSSLRNRYDGQCVTWRHGNLNAELESLLFRNYKTFYAASHIMRTTIRLSSVTAGLLPCFGLSVFTRFAAARKTHPMSGGVGRVHRDSASDYRDFRRKVFNIDLAPLPKSLALSEMDAELNRRAKIAL